MDLIVTSSHVAIIPPAQCTIVSIRKTDAADSKLTKFSVYDSSNTLIGSQLAGSGYSFTAAPGTTFAAGSTIGYVSVPSGTYHFTVSFGFIASVIPPYALLSLPSDATKYLDGTGKFSVPGTAPSAETFSAMAFIPGVGTDAQTILRVSLPQAIVFAAGAAASYAKAGTAAAASTVYTFKKNGSAFATATFAISGTVATWTQASNSTFAAGDLLEIDGPATADTTLADVGITLVGTKQ